MQIPASLVFWKITLITVVLTLKILSHLLHVKPYSSFAGFPAHQRLTQASLIGSHRGSSIIGKGAKRVSR